MKHYPAYPLSLVLLYPEPGSLMNNNCGWTGHDGTQVSVSPPKAEACLNSITPSTDFPSIHKEPLRHVHNNQGLCRSSETDTDRTIGSTWKQSVSLVSEPRVSLSPCPFVDVCADCQSPAPRWGSWNLGIFICVHCAAGHRKLGTHISKVYVQSSS